MEGNTNLFSKAKTSKEEAHAENKKQVGQDRTQERRLYNANFILWHKSAMTYFTCLQVSSRHTLTKAML